MRRFSRKWASHNVAHYQRRAEWLWRRATASQRVLPDFLIIGTMKGGTTSLYDYVCQHPKILSAYRKEVHYFDMHYSKGTQWYRANFPTRGEIAAAGEAAQTGESTPYYLFHPAGPTRLFNLLPHAKLVVVLRNPVDRAVSHYFHSVGTGMESRPIEQAFAEEASVVDPEHNNLMREDYESDQHRMWSYLSRGRYVDQLEGFLKLYRRDQLLVMQSEKLFADPQSCVDQTTDFLGVDRIRLPKVTVKNEGTYSKDGDPLKPELRLALQRHFEPYNARLGKLLGEDYGW
jgi:hypothetical protein